MQTDRRATLLHSLYYTHSTYYTLTAAVQTVVPSGLCAMCSTRLVWPVSSATRTIEGYFHRMSWLGLGLG